MKRAALALPNNNKTCLSVITTKGHYLARYIHLFEPLKTLSVKTTSCGFTGGYVPDYFLARPSSFLEACHQSDVARHSQESGTDHLIQLTAATQTSILHEILNHSFKHTLRFTSRLTQSDVPLSNVLVRDRQWGHSGDSLGFLILALKGFAQRATDCGGGALQWAPVFTYSKQGKSQRNNNNNRGCAHGALAIQAERFDVCASLLHVDFII